MNNKSQSILYWNCASGIFNKMNIIESKIQQFKPEIFFVSESNINLQMNCELLTIQNYNFMNSQTANETRKSRMCCFFKNDWAPNMTEMGKEDEIIILEKKDWTIIGIYRPFKVYENETASGNFSRLITRMQNYMTKYQDRKIIITGDFNIDYQKIGDKTYPRHQLATELMEFQIKNNLTQKVKEITRHRMINKNEQSILQTSLLDHVYTNGLHTEFISIEPTMASDHDIVIINLLDRKHV